MDNINLTVAKNLSDLRKQNKLTQLEVAEKLNYSDKAVSKWEQGESLPGIEVLYRLSRLYGVSLDYLVGDEKAPEPKAVQPTVRSRRRIITLLSVLAVWLTSTILYIAFDISLGKGIWMVGSGFAYSGCCFRCCVAQKQIFVFAYIGACVVDTALLLPAIYKIQYLDSFGGRHTASGGNPAVEKACKAIKGNTLW